MTDGRNGCVVVFGGTGFLGREIVRRFCCAGIRTRVATRHPDRSEPSAPSSAAGQVEHIYADVRDETSVAMAMDGCDAAVNAVGLYVETGAETFEAVHEMGALNVAHQTTVLDLKRLVHISGLGADMYSASPYIRARGKAEIMVFDACANATVLRPSVMFGPEDEFVNTLARITEYLPFVPLFGRGETRLQPVFVGDVAAATVKAITLEPEPGENLPGRCYELGGPQIVTYRALIQLILRHTHRKRWMLPIPFSVWRTAALACSLLPSPPLTDAQVVLMGKDNVVAKTALALADLGISPTSIEDVLPQYGF